MSPERLLRATGTAVSRRAIRGGLGVLGLLLGFLSSGPWERVSAQTANDTGFEPEQGFVAGDLNGQVGWSVDAGSAEVWKQTVHSGALAARVAPEGTISRLYPAATSLLRFRGVFQAVSSAAPELPASGAVVLYLDPDHGLTGLDGDGNGGGSWVGSGRSVPAGQWFEVEVAVDIERRTWSCSLEGSPVLQGLGFARADVIALRSLELAANAGDTLVDDLQLTSAVAAPETDPAVVTPAGAGIGFEPVEGYSVGNLDGQDGWAVEAGAAEVWTRTVFSGSQAARIAPGGSVSRPFATGLPLVTYSAMFQAKASVAPELPLHPQAAVLYLDPVLGLTGLDGDGIGGGTWVASQVGVADGTWFELTVRLDFSTKRWDCLVDGRVVLSGLHFQSDDVVALGSLVVGANAGDTLVDAARISAETKPDPANPGNDLPTVFPVGVGFEPGEGYFVGDLDGQEGWAVEEGDAEVWTSTVYSGAQAARIAPGGRVAHAYASALPRVQVRSFLQAVPSEVPDIPVVAQAAILYLDRANGLTGLDGDGAGGGHWVGSGIAPSAGQWFELVLELDFASKTWAAWVDGQLALTGLRFHSDDVAAFGTLTATAGTVGDTLVDALGVAVADAPPPPPEVTSLPSGVGFEPEEGYFPGTLDGQNGWRTEAGEALVWTTTVHSGVQAARIGPAGRISREFAVADDLVTVDVYLQATPSTAPAVPEESRIAVLYLDSALGLTGLDGDGNGGGSWVGSGVKVPAGTWFHAVIRMNFSTRTWSCFVDGNPILTDLHFHASGIASFATLTAGAAADGVTVIDEIGVTTEGIPVTPPTLGIVLSGDAVEISWPATATGYRLQVADDLADPRWTDVAVGGNTVRETVASGPRFYRLVRP